MSQESKFTSGPWSIGTFGEYIPGHTPINAPTHGGLAQVVTQMDGGNRPGDEIELYANARLVAAAPKLYRVAKVIEGAYLDGRVDEFHTRLNELAGGSSGAFAELLIDALGTAEVAA